MSGMDSAAYLAAISRDGRAFREAVASVPMSEPVVSCPGWTNADQIWHLSEVQYFWATAVVERATGWDAVPRLERVSDDELLVHYDATLAALLDVLSTADPATRVWTWSHQQDVAFVIRRMALETAVHRWDAELTAGHHTAIDPELASDGIDEFLEHFLSDVSEGSEPVGGSVHIHCGDTPGEWTIRPSADGYDVTREHAKGDCALRGDASNLLLALWRRVGPEAIDVVGDEGVARRFLAATNLD
jgi:uncharacterized protein (TIGR03083 family)